jgi:hypothetical protein
MEHEHIPSKPVHDAALVLQHMGFDVTHHQVKAAIDMFLASAKNYDLELQHQHCCHHK